MNPNLVFKVLLAVFVLFGALNVYVASALRSRAPGLARRGMFSAAAFGVGVVSLLLRHNGMEVPSLAAIAVMLGLFALGLLQKGAFPKL